MKKTPVEMTKEQLLADFKIVVADTEALLKASADQGGEKMAEIRAKAEESLHAVKQRLGEAQDALVEKTKEAAHAADAYVHEKPWNAIGIAAGVGLIIGLLIHRR